MSRSIKRIFDRIMSTLVLDRFITASASCEYVVKLFHLESGRTKMEIEIDGQSTDGRLIGSSIQAAAQHSRHGLVLLLIHILTY